MGNSHSPVFLPLLPPKTILPEIFFSVSSRSFSPCKLDRSYQYTQKDVISPILRKRKDLKSIMRIGAYHVSCCLGNPAFT